MERPRVAKLLPYLASQGWLKRIRNGIYVSVPLEASTPEGWAEDPWVLLSRVFQPAYIGGWSAAHHWGLTDQLFRTTIVYTQKQIRETRGEVQGLPFTVHTIPPQHFFGTERVWRDDCPIEVSDASRTIIDLLDTPADGGGMRHIAEILQAYLESQHADQRKLLDYAERLGNRTVYKRLGYLIEHLGQQEPVLTAECLTRRSRGISLLDPDLPAHGQVDRRWELRENVSFEDQE